MLSLIRTTQTAISANAYPEQDKRLRTGLINWGRSMTCTHLRQLYDLCQKHELKLGGSDLIRMVCHQCGEQEVCPSTLMDEYDHKQKQSSESKEHKTTSGND